MRLTQYEKQILQWEKELKPITPNDKRVQLSLKHYGHYMLKDTHKDKAWCSKCGYVGSFDDYSFKRGCVDGFGHYNGRYVCPNCAEKLEQFATFMLQSMTNFSLPIVEYHHGHQVIRNINFMLNQKVGDERFINIRETSRNWISDQGEITLTTIIINLRRTKGSSFYDRFNYGKRFGIKHWKEIDDEWELMYYFPTVSLERTECYYPQIGPIWRKRGITASILRKISNKVELFSAIVKRPMVELLLKGKQFNLLNYDLLTFMDLSWHGRSYIEAKNNLSEDDAYLIPAIKICTRHHYVVKDLITWLDYVSMLYWNGKDVRNPHYICPSNLKRAHDKELLQTHKRHIREGRETEIAERESETEEFEEEYKKHVAPFKHLQLERNGLKIRPIMTVKEMKKEGEAMHHCVFKARYFAKKNSLILSCRKNSKRIATIELSLPDMQPLQVKGPHNSTPKYKDDILDILLSLKQWDSGINRDCVQ